MESGLEPASGDLIEQIPEYTLNTLDDGACVKLILVVQLPGVDTSAGLSVHAKDRRIHLHLPGRYKLDVPLGVEVAEKALKLRFVKGKQKLRAEYEVIGRAAQAPTSPAQTAQSAESNELAGAHAEAASSASPEPAQAQMQKDVETGVHDSFLQEALRLQQKSAAKASKRASRNVKVNGFHNGDAPATSAEQKPAGSAAQAEDNSSGTASSSGPLPGLKEPRSSLKPEEAQGSRSAQQTSSPAAAQQAEHSGQNGLPSKQASQTAVSSHKLDSRSRDEHNAAARVTHATEESSDRKPSVHGELPVSTSGQDSGSLYDAATIQGNREAAAQCACKAEEALQQRDFDKAERLYAKAARLAPGGYEEAAAGVAGERAEYEIFQAEQAREAKKQKREAEKRKREAERRQKQEEGEAQERRARAEAAAGAEAAARAEAEAQQHSDGANSGTWEDWSEEPGSARSNAPRPDEYREAYHWGVPLPGPLQYGMSFLYTLFAAVLLWMHARKFVVYVEGLRHGTNPQRASLAAGVLMAWALTLRIIFALVWWTVPLVWAVWRAVFWRPSLTAALIEVAIGVCLIVVLPPAVGDLFLLPLMWYWVGGGFSAVFGTSSCLASIFLIMDPEVTKARPWFRPYTCAIHLSTPLAYTVLARWTGWIGQTLWAAFTAWRIWRILRRPPSKAEIPPGMVGTPSCGPEPVPSGAVPEVAKVLQAASWYEVLEVAASASPEEIKRAHKLKSLGTHPDKVGAANNAGAHEASVRVNMAREVLLSEDKRRAYDAEMVAAETSMYSEPDPWQGSSSTSGRRASNGGTTGDGGFEAMFHDFNGQRNACSRGGEHSNPDCVCMPCQCCPKWHHVYVTKRPRHAAYYCQSCRRYHAATGRQFWKESGLGSMLGLSSEKYFLYLNGAVLDITDVMVNCEAWSFIATHCPPPRCVEGMTFKGNFLPVREECFAAHAQPGETYYSQAHTRTGAVPRNNKRKGRRRR